MDNEIPLNIRQNAARHVKSQLIIVYPNALPHVLSSEAVMIESMAFATAKNTGQYIPTVSSYIFAHLSRKNFAHCVHRIPRLSQHEETARVISLRKIISSHDDCIAQNPSNTHQASANIAVAAPSSQPRVVIAPPSNQPAVAITTVLGQPPAVVPLPSTNPYPRHVLPQVQGISNERMRQVQNELAQQQEQALKAQAEIKERRAKTLRSKRAQLSQQQTGVLQAQNHLPHQPQNSKALQTQQLRNAEARNAEALHSQALQSQAFQSQALQSQALQSHDLQSQALQTKRKNNVQVVQAQQALSGINHVRPPHKVPQRQNLAQNQGLPTASSLPQVQPLHQSQIPSELLTDEALGAHGPQQMHSLLREVRAPNRRGSQALSQVPNVNAQSVPNNTPNIPIHSVFAAPRHPGLIDASLTSQLPQSQRTLHAGIQQPAFNNMSQDMKSTVETGNSRLQQLRQQVTRRSVDKAISGQVPNQAAGNQPMSLSITDRGSSVHGKLPTQTRLSGSLDPQQQVIWKNATQNPASRQTYSDGLISKLANVAVSLENKKRKSREPQTIEQTPKGSSGQLPMQQTTTRPTNTGMPGKSNAATQITAARPPGSPLPMSREKRVRLAKWITLQRDFRTRLGRLYPILKVLLMSNRTEPNMRTLKNIQVIRHTLQQTTMQLAENPVANSNYNSYVLFLRRLFEQYARFEHITEAEAKRMVRRRHTSGANVSLHSSAQPQSTQRSPLRATANTEVLLSQMQQIPSNNVLPRSQGLAQPQTPNPHADILEEQKRAVRARNGSSIARNITANGPETARQTEQAEQIQNQSAHANNSSQTPIIAQNLTDPSRRTKESVAKLNGASANASKVVTGKRVEIHIQDEGADLNALAAATATRQAAIDSNYETLTARQSNLKHGSLKRTALEATSQGKSIRDLENQALTSQQSVDVGKIGQGNKSSLNAQTQHHGQRHLPASSPANHLDVTRAHPIVPQQVNTNIERVYREHISKMAGPYDITSGQSQTEPQNSNNPVGQNNAQANTNENATEFQASAFSPRVLRKQVIQGTEIPVGDSHVSKKLSDNKIDAANGQVNIRNGAFRYHDAAPTICDDKIDGCHRVKVTAYHRTTQQSEAAQRSGGSAVNSSYPKTSPANTQIEKNRETTQAVVDLEKTLQEPIDHFEQAINENAALDVIHDGEEHDTNTDDEAISDLQDLLDGRRSRKRSARVLETLEDLGIDCIEIEEAKSNGSEPTEKRQKTLSLREEVGFDCELVHESYDFVKCLIQGELESLEVNCTVHVGDQKIPNLNMKVLKGYPSEGKVQYNFEAPASGWVPLVEDMKSRFTESMRSAKGDCGVDIIVREWVAAIQSVVRLM